MRLGRPILVAFVATALAAYVLDCSGTTTPAEAMKCCQSMPCSSSGHSQECCETMPQMHAPFVQSPSAHGFSFTPDLIAVLSIFQQALRAGSAVSRLAASCHGPPRASPPTSTPLPIEATSGTPRSTTSILVSGPTLSAERTWNGHRFTQGTFTGGLAGGSRDLCRARRSSRRRTGNSPAALSGGRFGFVQLSFLYSRHVRGFYWQYPSDGAPNLFP